MEDGNRSFLRKQECRLLCASSCGSGGQAGTLGFFLDSCLRSNDAKVSPLLWREEWLHSAKMVTVHGVGTTTYRGIRRTDRSILYCRLHRRGERGNQPACKSLVGNGLASVNGYLKCYRMQKADVSLPAQAGNWAVWRLPGCSYWASGNPESRSGRSCLGSHRSVNKPGFSLAQQ